MGVQLRTSRGLYSLAFAGEAERLGDFAALTLSLAHGDGIEKVAWRCQIATALLGGAVPDDLDELLDRLAPWVERFFEQVREAALKSIRSEHRLLEVVFDESNRGPF